MMRWRNALGELHEFGLPYVNLHLHVLRTVVKRAELHTGDRELVSVVWLAHPFRLAARLPSAPPPDFLTRILPVARNPGEQCWLLLAGLAGLRKGELLGLRPGDYNAGVVHVQRQRGADHRKNRLPHAFKVSDPLMRWSLEWTLAHRSALVPRSGSFLGRSDGFLFPWSEKLLEGFLARIRAHLGADAHAYLPAGTGWHHFRRWGATKLAREGASVWDVMRWLGDVSPEMAAAYVDLGRGAVASLTLPQEAAPLR